MQHLAKAITHQSFLTCISFRFADSGGGGIRTAGEVEKLFQLGVDYVILGAMAFSDPETIPLIQRNFSTDSIIVALDNRNGKVMVEGWKTKTAFTVAQALEKFAKIGARSFLITSITQDGMLQGPDLDTLCEAAEYPDVEIIAAGGIGNLDDLAASRRLVWKELSLEKHSTRANST